MHNTKNISSRIEWQTITLMFATYLGFAGITWFFNTLPWFVLVPVGGYLVCLFGSLQHEAVHGHPTGIKALNEALVFPALGLWMPFGRYKALHLAHHNDEILTDPTDDPESYYWTAEQWASVQPILRGIFRFNNTLVGRLSVGPLIAVCQFFAKEVSLLRHGQGTVRRDWLMHGAGVAIALFWIIGVCSIPIWQYILYFAYPGLSLTLLRSFAEHRAHRATGARTAVLEAGPIMSLLYLNNNLHAAHHAVPRLPWYELPAYYISKRDSLLERNQSYLVNGYTELFRSYLLRPKEPTVHPVLQVQDHDVS